MAADSEVAAQVDFSIVRYALCWEDADILLEALDPGPEDVCLSIAAAGDNTLSLLSRGPARVVAVDLSPAQIACLDLRVAAFRTLPHQDIVALFGGHSGADAVGIYDRLRAHLAPATRAVWDPLRRRIAGGVGRAGRFESYVRLFGRCVLPLIHCRATIEAALQPRGRTERVAFFDNVWNTWRWRLLVRLFTSRAVSGWLGRDPALFRYAEGDVAARTLERGRVALVEMDPAINPYLHWIALGHYGGVLPHWLRPENHEPILRNLDRLEVHVAGLEAFLAGQPARAFTRFNLSDVFEYVSPDHAARCFADIVRVARPGAKLAYWNTFVTRHRPEVLSNWIVPITALARELHARDKAFFYSDFVVEERTGADGP